MHVVYPALLGPVDGATLWDVTAKERVLAEAPSWTEEQAELALRAVESNGEPEMAELPEGWRTFEDGTPVPNWVALLERSRRGH
jgi:hypothetical protein